MKRRGQNVAKGKKKTIQKAVVKKAAAKKAPAKKTAVKKAPAKKASAKKTAVKKAKPQKKNQAKNQAKPIPKSKVMPKKETAIKTAASKTLVSKVPKAAKAVNLSNFVTPLDDRVIIQPASTEKMTAGGLYIPETVSDVSGNLQGTVVSVGRGHRNKKGQIRPMDLKVGDRVLFADYTGSKISIQNHDLVIVREGDVLGVVG